jgi:arylformamidase
MSIPPDEVPPMTWIDVSVPLTMDRPSWPGDEPFRYDETDTILGGSEANCARMRLSVHFGTHVDAPYHFIDGARTIDALDLGLLVGPGLVVDLTDVEEVIEPRHLEGRVPPGTLRLLAKTRNSAIVRDRTFHRDFVAFSEGSARWLVERGVRLLGIDYFSIAPFPDQRPTHVAFLGADGAVIENLDLQAVPPGPYEVLCLPIKIAGSGGAPARVLLRGASHRG